MPVVNYTTTVSAEKTIWEIQQRLAKHGAKRIAVDYDDAGEPSGLSFMIIHPEHGPRLFSLPVDTEAMRRVLVRQVGGRPGSKATSPEQAARVAWRVMKDWIAAQLALVETTMVGLDEVMLPYIHVDGHGTTLREQYRRHEIGVRGGE